MSQPGSAGWTRARRRAGSRGCIQTPPWFSFRQQHLPFGTAASGKPTVLHVPCWESLCCCHGQWVAGCIPCIAWEQFLCGCWVRVCLHWHSSGPAEHLEGDTVQPQRSPWFTVTAEAASSSEEPPCLQVSLCFFVTHSLFNHYIFPVVLPCFEAVSEFAIIPLHTTPDTAVREIDELYDVYLDVKQRWKTEVGCHICVTNRALVLSHWPRYSLFRAENLKPIDK